MKFFISIFLLSTKIFAELLNGISVTVNEEPITLYEVEKTVKEKKVPKSQAIELLIDQVLYTQEVRKYNIRISQRDVDLAIERLAAQNKMDIVTFKQAVEQKQTFFQFKKDLQKQLQHQKLIQYIASNKITPATDEDLKIYYNNNLSEFVHANDVDVIYYIAKNKSALEAIKKNPLLRSNEIRTSKQKIDLTKANPQLKYLLNQTPVQSYTPIFTQNNTFHLFYVQEKLNTTVLTFEDVKDRIFTIIMKKRENEFLKNHFETIKLTANIQMFN